ncbi:MAG: cation transporter [Betaproteobacteria bacterium]|nr:cation transporter [Betaproteobacteria bacterium]
MSEHRYPPRERRRPAFLTALAITAGYALVELAGGFWTGSLALLGDAGHMFSDALALGLAAVAAHLALRPAGRRHSYGWARAEVIGALVNSMLMLAVVLALVVESVARLQAPRPVAAAEMMLIAFVGMLMNGTVAWILGRSELTLNVRAALLHVMGDLVSSFAALVAGAVILATGWLPIDSILSLVIAGLILVSTFKLLRDTLHVLMEGVPPALELSSIGQSLAQVPGVVSVHDLHVWSIAPDKVALSAHVELDDLQRWPAILAAAGALLHERYGIGHITLQPEVRSAPGASRTATSVIRLQRRNSGPESGIS